MIVEFLSLKTNLSNWGGSGGRQSCPLLLEQRWKEKWRMSNLKKFLKQTCLNTTPVQQSQMLMNGRTTELCAQKISRLKFTLGKKERKPFLVGAKTSIHLKPSQLLVDDRLTIIASVWTVTSNVVWKVYYTKARDFPNLLKDFCPFVRYENSSDWQTLILVRDGQYIINKLWNMPVNHVFHSIVTPNMIVFLWNERKVMSIWFGCLFGWFLNVLIDSWDQTQDLLTRSQALYWQSYHAPERDAMFYILYTCIHMFVCIFTFRWSLLKGSKIPISWLKNSDVYGLRIW